MFNKIEISHFKAFENDFTIDFHAKNFLVYGDNGSGKSSLYEAFELALDYARFKRDLTAGINEEDERYGTELISSLNERFLCLQGDGDFSVRLDGVSYDIYNSSQLNVFCVDSRIFDGSVDINLKHLLTRTHWHCLTIPSVESFLQAHGDAVITNANQVLRDVLFEELNIQKKEDWSITLRDVWRDFSKDKSFDVYFNESKIHLVKLALLLESAKLMMEDERNSILLLDDVVSSLDTANRTCIMHYLLDDLRLSHVHKIILTHNMNFFNLIRFSVEEMHQSADWQVGRIYELNHNHKYFDWAVLETDFDDVLDKISDETQEHGEDSIRLLGNRLRQMLERYIDDYLFLSSTVLKPNVGDLINSLLKLNPQKGELEFYKFENGEVLSQSTAIVAEIRKVIKHDGHDMTKEKRDLVMDIEAILAKYKNDDNWKIVKDSLSNIKLLLKTSLHPLSHNDESKMTIKELRVTAQYVKKLKDTVLPLSVGKIDLNN